MTLPSHMMAVVTTGNGGYDKLDYRRVPVPTPGPDDLIIKVLAAGVNNTEINTRLGWYSASVTTGTGAFSDHQQTASEHKADGGWNAATPFPIIQGTDCCGIVVTHGSDDNHPLLGKRVLVRACMREHGFDQIDNIWMASDFDGAFAEYVAVPAREVFAVDCDWSDAELATIPCAYATAETMLLRAGCNAADHVVVVGASGGVGSATIQLAKLRGASVTAITSPQKMAAIEALGADNVLSRDDDIIEKLGERSVDLVVDNVAGAGFASMMKLLRAGGRYTSSGAIAGPMVTLDMRDMYLKDITLIGTTAWDEAAFPNLIRYIETGQIVPVLDKTFPLSEIATAQAEFVTRQHIGNIVLIP